MTIFRVRAHTERPLRWWHEQHRLGKIEMSPRYQRRSELWGRWKQAHLIDSILNDFDIPKFYLADFTSFPSGLNETKKPYALIDGKQRFEAIFNFLDGELPLNHTFSLLSEPNLNVGGMGYVDLKKKHPRLASKIEDFIPDVMSVVTDDESKIDQLFIRLNSGEAANSAERRNAMPGPVPRMIRNLTLHPFFQEKIRFQTKRMQDSSLAAKLLLIEYREGFVDTKARNLDNFVREAAREEDKALQGKKGNRKAARQAIAPYEAAEARVLEVLERLSPRFRDSDPLLASQGHIPVYYWFAREQGRRLPWFRAFLEAFTEDVKRNMQLSRLEPDSADPELMNYYTAGRTTNDEGSLRQRYQILSTRFDRFIAGRNHQVA